MRAFFLFESCAPHVGTVNSFRADCKQCQVNTTWEQTPAGRRLKRDSVLSLPLRFVFGVEKFR